MNNRIGLIVASVFVFWSLGVSIGLGVGVALWTKERPMVKVEKSWVGESKNYPKLRQSQMSYNKGG